VEAFALVAIYSSLQKTPSAKVAAKMEIAQASPKRKLNKSKK